MLLGLHSATWKPQRRMFSTLFLHIMIVEPKSISLICIIQPAAARTICTIFILSSHETQLITGA